MTINQSNGLSKEAGIIRKVLSLEGFAIFQNYFYLKRLMRLHSDICVLFTPSEPEWPSTDAPMREVLDRSRQFTISFSQCLSTEPLESGKKCQGKG